MDYLAGKLTKLYGDTDVPTVTLQQTQVVSTQTEHGTVSIATQTNEAYFSPSGPPSLQKQQISPSQRTSSILRQALTPPALQPQSASPGVHTFIRERLAQLQQPLPRSTLTQKDGIVKKIRPDTRTSAQTETKNTTQRSLPPWDQVNIMKSNFIPNPSNILRARKSDNNIWNSRRVRSRLCR